MHELEHRTTGPKPELLSNTRVPGVTLPPLGPAPLLSAFQFQQAFSHIPVLFVGAPRSSSAQALLSVLHSWLPQIPFPNCWDHHNGVFLPAIYPATKLRDLGLIAAIPLLRLSGVDVGVRPRAPLPATQPSVASCVLMLHVPLQPAHHQPHHLQTHGPNGL